MRRGRSLRSESFPGRRSQCYPRRRRGFRRCQVLLHEAEARVLPRARLALDPDIVDTLLVNPPGTSDPRRHHPGDRAGLDGSSRFLAGSLNSKPRAHLVLPPHAKVLEGVAKSQCAQLSKVDSAPGSTENATYRGTSLI